MAKDGTARGGQRVGAGRKSKALTEKVVAGNPGNRKLKVVDLPKVNDLDGADAELCELLNKSFYMARTTKVPYLSEEECKIVLKCLENKYSK